MVEWLSSIKKKDLISCGKLVLTGDMSTLSITKVDLSNMSTLKGKLCCLKILMLEGCCPKATPKRMFLECALFVLDPPFSPLHCTTLRRRYQRAGRGAN